MTADDLTTLPPMQALWTIALWALLHYHAARHGFRAGERLATLRARVPGLPATPAAKLTNGEGSCADA